MLSQYLRALPFHPQCGTVGINPNTLLTDFVAVSVYPKYLKIARLVTSKEGLW